MRAEKFLLGDMPLDLLDDSFEFIRDFSTFFVVKGKLAGSGTFVRLNGISGILTAHHVWDLIVESNDREIGIQISNRSHRFTILLEHLVPLFGLRGRSEAFGPDIVFIKIPLVKVGAIEARRSFYNLDVSRPERHTSAKNSFGLCIVAGAPGDRVTAVRGARSSSKMISVFVFGAILGRTRVHRKGGFDYWDLKTLSRDKNGQMESFGGMSGGGVWKVILRKKPGEKLSLAKVAGVYLGGVAFYQSALRGDWRFLRAHGPTTIYRKLQRLTKNR